MRGVSVSHPFLKIARTAARLTQVELALRTGISQSLLCLVEKGEKQPDASVARRIAFELGLEVSDLFPNLKEKSHADDCSDPR